MNRRAEMRVLFPRMMPAGPDDDRAPLHVVPPTRVPTGGRWRLVAVGAMAVVVLAAAVAAAMLPAGDPSVSGVAASPASPTAFGGEDSSSGQLTPPGSGVDSFVPSIGPGVIGAPGTVSPVATPWVPGPPGRLAVVTPQGSLELIDDVTGATTPVALDGQVDLPPAWSPDGSRVAAIVNGPGFARLEVLGPSGGATVVYTSAQEAPFYAYWAPDGTRLGLLADDLSDGISLRTAMADGTAPTDGVKGDGVVRRGAPLYFVWQGNARLLLHVGAGATSFTGVVGLSGQGEGAALPGSGDFRVAAAGRDTVASVTGGSNPAIVVTSANGTQLARMPALGPAAVSFDPAGQKLAAIAPQERAAISPTTPLGPLRLLDPAGGRVRTLVGDGVFAFYWSPDSTTLAVLRLAPPASPSAAGEGDVRLAATSPTPSAGPLVTHLLFLNASDGAVRSDRVVQPGEAFVQNVLPYFDQYALSHPVWSPDSRAIVLPLIDDSGRTMATVLRVDGTDPRPIAEGVYATWSR